MFFRRRTREVAVAIVYAPDWGFYLAYNRRWGGYTFPMSGCRPLDVDPAHTAVRALREATGLPLRQASARGLADLAVVGESGAVGRETAYRYHLFEIDPGVDLPTTLAPHGFACQSGFLPPSALLPVLPGEPTPARAPLPADLLTWSTIKIAGDLLGNQQVAVAVLCRRGLVGSEFLMIRYPSYHGYFPVASRLGGEAGPRYAALEALWSDTGYRPRPQAGGPLPVVVRQNSPRYGCERQFVFHLVPIDLPGVNLDADNNALEQSLERSGAMWRWVASAELDDPVASGLSPTVAFIRDALRDLAAAQGCA